LFPGTAGKRSGSEQQGRPGALVDVRRDLAGPNRLDVSRGGAGIDRHRPVGVPLRAALAPVDDGQDHRLPRRRRQLRLALDRQTQGLHTIADLRAEERPVERAEERAVGKHDP